MARVTLRLPDELDDAVEDYVGYGSKSEFYRQSATEKLVREGELDESELGDEEETQTDGGDREPVDA